MSDLYSTAEPYDTGNLEVTDGHRLYFEQVGNRSGLPVVFIHGGPGSGCNPSQRRFFAADRFRAILYDQRGAGRSRPVGILAGNDTYQLVHDLERLREWLEIKRWLVFAGSWGATLGLLYTQRFPDRVLGMVLRGTFLARPVDLAWFFGQRGVARIFPDEYREFLEPLPTEDWASPAEGYRRLLQDPEPKTRLAAALAWRAWEDRVTEHNLPKKDATPPADTEALVSRAAIASHYAASSFFLDERGALTAPERLTEVPGAIVHGRRDLVVPVENATTLHQHWPTANLEIIEDCGHLANEPATARASINALERIAGTVGG